MTVTLYLIIGTVVGLAFAALVPDADLLGFGFGLLFWPILVPTAIICVLIVWLGVRYGKNPGE